MRETVHILTKTILLLLLPVFQSFGQIVEIHTTTDSTSFMIGEQIKFHFTVKADSEALIHFPVVEGNLPSQVQLLNSSELDTTYSDSKILYKKDYLITCFDSGSYQMPSFPVSFTYRGRIDTAWSHSFYFDVYSPEVDTTLAIKDIKGPINTPLTFSELLPYFGYGLGGLIILAGIIFLLRKRKNQPGVFRKMVRKIPPHEMAFKELDKLKEDKLWQNGKVKEYYVSLSEIIRKYIDGRYDIPALEFVTEEIMRDIKQKQIEDEYLLDMLENLLRTADMAKFAKEDPLPAENQTNMNNAYLFVEKTKFVEVPTLEENLEESINQEKIINRDE